MIIEYFGHSCFRVTDGTRSVVFDPFSDIGYDLPRLKADFCVCSHKHYDHFATQAVDCKAVVTEENAEEFPFLKAIGSFHDECKGAKRGKNTVFLFNSDEGITFCHMGDIGEPLSEFMKNRTVSTDILAVPIGGNYTIDSDEAIKYCNAIKPEIILPMHYKTPHGNIDISGKKDFLNRFSSDKIVKSACRLTVNRVDVEKGGKFYDKTIDFDDDNF